MNKHEGFLRLPTLRCSKGFKIIIGVIGSIVILFMLGYFGQEDQARLEAHRLSTDLTEIYNAWVASGRSANFDATKPVWGGGYDYIVFTNRLMVAGHPYHCRFGVRPGIGIMPPGVLAITDEGVVVFIADQDGRVIVSPGKHGFPRDLKVMYP